MLRPRIGPQKTNDAHQADADDNFEAVHHDIGRITSASSPTVAGATVVRNIPEVPEAHVSPEEVRTSQHRAVAAPQQAPRRKATKRVTYAIKPHAPIEQPIAAPVPVAVEQPSRVSRHNAAQVRHRQQLPQQQRIAQAAPVLPPQPEPLPIIEQPQHHQQAPPSVQPMFGHQPAESFSGPLSLATAPAQLDSPPIAHHSPRQSPQFSSSIVISPQPAAPIVASTSIDEPLPEPSFDSVVSSGCPQLGVFSWPHKGLCDQYYKCTNGTFTEESCPNGLAYSKLGAVYQHCAYNWNVDCGHKKSRK